MHRYDQWYVPVKAMNGPNPLEILTVGHSTHSYESFLCLLRKSNVTAIADVRSSPHSRHFPQFNRDTLRDELRMDGIAYVFLGDQLGGRPKDKAFYCDGVADYEKMATANEFDEGIERVIDGAKKFRIALMCSEHDPLDCHRCLLVGRELAKRKVDIRHILADGGTVSQREIEEGLIAAAGRDHDDLFMSREETLANGYRIRARKVAYADPTLDPKSPIAAE
jgi:uncharacterized protein (DUF488 family)